MLTTTTISDKNLSVDEIFRNLNVDDSVFSRAFIWRYTEDGYDFWDGIDDKWKTLCARIDISNSYY